MKKQNKKVVENANSTQKKERKFRFKFTIKDMVICAFILAIFLAAKSLNTLIPDIFMGARFQLIYLILPIISLVFGWKYSGITMSIYVFILVWIAPGFFIRGITYTTGPGNVLLEYLLDYIIPILALAIIPGLFAPLKNKKLANKNAGFTLMFIILFVTIAFAIAFISHFTAGVVLWADYATEGYGPYAYSAMVNSIVVWSAYGFAIVFAYPCATRIKVAINGVFANNGYNKEEKEVEIK